MKPLFYPTLFLFACLFPYTQESIASSEPIEPTIQVTEKTIFYKLAENTIPIRIQQYGEKAGIVFINLHDDEMTSVNAAKRILEEYGGTLLEIENNAQRNIRFRLGQFIYKVDPNRIFSKEGIRKSLEQLGRTSGKAIDEASKLGERILELIPVQTGCIIALHNNTPGLFSAVEYTAGNKRAADSKAVSINPEQDADDFFLTTDNSLYQKLADKGFNTILQDNKNCTEDGSLSVYCGKKNMRYVNCETEHGKSGQYYLMMQALLAILESSSEK
ncbi:MAG TPA: hypothetical protein VFP97_03360 [Chitinophagaceae bacterium]|nr:hypothetical protein [Chitinophagaceae bacterium]